MVLLGLLYSSETAVVVSHCEVHSAACRKGAVRAISSVTVAPCETNVVEAWLVLSESALDAIANDNQ